MKFGRCIALVALALLAASLAPHHHHLQAICLTECCDDTPHHHDDVEDHGERCVATSYYVAPEKGQQKCDCGHDHVDHPALVALPAPPEGPLQNDLPTPVQPLRIPTSSGTDRAHSLRAPPHFIS